MQNCRQKDLDCIPDCVQVCGLIYPAALSLSQDCSTHNLAFRGPLIREIRITAVYPWITEKMLYEYLHDSHSQENSYKQPVLFRILHLQMIFCHGYYFKELTFFCSIYSFVYVTKHQFYTKIKRVM